MLAGQGESFASRYAVTLVVLLAAALVYAPLIFLRYDFLDSWAFLFVVNAARVYNFAIGCLETHEHSYLIGRPLYPAAICAMTAPGPIVDLLWVPRLQGFLALLASGGILAGELRRGGASVAVVALSTLSLLFLPGTLLMVAHMAANPIALGVLAATIAGYIWVRRLRRPAATRRGRAGWIALAVALLVVSMALYQVVATVFFTPLLIAMLFGGKPEGRAALRFALGAIAAFAAASAIYLAAHHLLLYGFYYFFLVPDQVADISSTMRSASVGFTPTHFLEKLAYLGVLLPKIGTLWFVSEWAPYSWPVAAAAACVASCIVLLLRRSGGLGRFAAVTVVVTAFFVPYLAGDNLGNPAWSALRVIMFMQVPVVILAWWLVHLLLETPMPVARLAAGAAVAAVFAGAVVSYLTVLRAYVIPNYMELKHVEVRVRDAFQRNVQHFYIIQPERARLRATLGSHGHGAFATITTAINPLHMVTAILTELEQKRPLRSVIPVPAEKGDAVTPGPDRIILDMRKFP